MLCICLIYSWLHPFPHHIKKKHLSHSSSWVTGFTSTNMQSQALLDRFPSHKYGVLSSSHLVKIRRVHAHRQKTIFRRNSENHTKNLSSEYAPTLPKALFSPETVLSHHKAWIHLPKLISHLGSSLWRTCTKLSQQSSQTQHWAGRQCHHRLHAEDTYPTPLFTTGWFLCRDQPKKIPIQRPIWTSNICALTESNGRREDNFYLCILDSRSDHCGILFRIWISLS